MIHVLFSCKKMMPGTSEKRIWQQKQTVGKLSKLLLLITNFVPIGCATVVLEV